MKKLAVFLMCLSVSMFALGCGGGDAKKPPAKQPPAEKTEKTPQGEKKPEEQKQPEAPKAPEGENK